MNRACVIGSGPNGLAAAIAMARAGLPVEVYEAEPIAGGAARTMELTEPGFKHDFGSAVHPLGAGSPFFSSLPLAEYGLQWIHGTSPLAHPLDDGTAVTLEHSLRDQEAQLGEDGAAWRELMEPIAAQWSDFIVDAMGPPTRIPRRPLLMASFARKAMQPANALARRTFRGERARALFAGLAAHSFLSFDEPLSPAVGLVLGAAAHVVGWPVPRGGSQAITNALIGYLEKLNGSVYTSRRVRSLDETDPEGGPVLCDLTPRQLLSIAGDRLQKTYRKAMQEFRYGPGIFKIDYALSAPIPWTARECNRAITVHLGGTLEEIASFGICGAPRCGRREAVRAGRAALAVRSNASTGRQARGVDVLPHPERLDRGYDRPHRGADGAICSRLQRLRPGAAYLVARAVRGDGRQPDRRRHRRRGVVDAAILLSSSSGELLHGNEEPVSLFGVNAAGRRRAWNVRLPRSAHGVAALMIFDLPSPRRRRWRGR